MVLIGMNFKAHILEIFRLWLINSVPINWHFLPTTEQASPAAAPQWSKLEQKAEPLHGPISIATAMSYSLVLRLAAPGDFCTFSL